MKKGSILVLIFLLATAIGAECATIKQRLKVVEQRLDLLEKGEIEMAMMPDDLDLFVSPDDPDHVGDLRLVTETPVSIDTCDSLDQWGASGAGVTIALDHSRVDEGTASLKITVPSGIDSVVTATKSSGVWDFSALKYITARVYRETTVTGTKQFKFGEAAYDEQSYGIPAIPTNQWYTLSWNISAISAGSRDGVTMFSFRFLNSDSVPAVFWFDKIQCVSGPSQLKGVDNDRVYQLYPKIYVGYYVGTGTGSSKTVTVARKGVPSRIDIDCVGRVPHRWIAGMTTGHVWKYVATGTAAWEDNTGLLSSVNDGNFVVTSNLNAVDEVYLFTMFWAD